MYKPISFFCLLLCLPFLTAGQAKTDSVPAPLQSRLLRFAETGRSETDRVVLRVFIREQDMEEPVLGATVLLQRQNPDQVHGKISQWDGRCKFKVAAGMYNFRIQLTGMVTFEKQNIELLAGRQYDMDIEMVRMGQPVPSAKQQAGKN
jgi:hypothetical protein